MKMKKKTRPPLVGRGLDGRAYGQHHKQQHKTEVEYKTYWTITIQLETSPHLKKQVVDIDNDYQPKKHKLNGVTY